MTRPAPESGRRTFRPVFALTVAATLAASLIGGTLLAGPAAAATPAATTVATAAATAAAAAKTVAATGAAQVAGTGLDAPLLGDPGFGVKFEVAVNQAYTPDDPGYPSFDIGVYADGRVKLQSNGRCLDTWSYDGKVQYRNYGVLGDCIENPSQAYYFVPVTPNPNARPNTSEFEHFFYIVSESGRSCLSSPGRGLFPKSQIAAKLTPCSSEDPGQWFRILNDTPDRLGISRQWENILGLAVKYATNHCDGYSGPDENAPCAVSTDTDYRTATWSAAGSAAARSLGTLTTRSAGCGTTVSTSLPSMHNAGSTPLPVKLITSGSYTHQTSVSNTETSSAEYSASYGPKDLFSQSVKLGFSWAHQEVTVNTDTSSRTTEVDPTLQPGEWLKGTWESSVLQFTGLWKLGIDTPAAHKGELTWYVPATSILPAALTSTGASPLTYTVLITRTEKNCDAEPASTNATPPTVSASADCQTTAAVRAGTTVYACPGAWNIPGGVNPNPVFAYQWYTIAQGSTAITAISGATAPTYTVPDQLVPVSPSVGYLGVIVTDLGPVTRRESTSAISTNTAQLQPRLPGAPLETATNFVGRVPDASVGARYTTALVTDPGTGMHLTSDVSELDGLSISDEGILSGIPAAAGDFTFEVTDTPTGGSAPQTVTMTLHVAGESTVYTPQTAFQATVGTAFSENLVVSGEAGLDLALTGVLPDGLSLDARTGVVSGTPTAAGDRTFTLTSAWSAQTFTISVSDVATVLSPDALPAGTVGVPYDAQTVTRAGTNVSIGLVGRQPNGGVDYSENAPVGQLGLPDLSGAGLALDADTGAISGTPTRAGTISLTVTNLTDPTAASQTKTIVIAAAGQGGAVTPAPAVAAKPGSGHLAATGSEAGSGLLLALLLLGAGVALAVVRRRRRLG